MEKNISVSKNEAIDEDTIGGMNQLFRFLSLSKILASIVCATRNAIPEPTTILIDMRSIAFNENNDVVVASRFMKGGSMKGCPLIKSILVRLASSTLYIFSSIPVKDASNGFRLFSRRLLDTVYIESKVGFAYSLELLSKCNRLKLNVKEIPAQWEERSEGSSRFKILKWLPEYLRWYFYGLGTSWLKKKPEDVKKKTP